MKGTKLLALILAISVLFSLVVPVQALAASGDTHEDVRLNVIDNGWTQANAGDSVQDSSSSLLISGISPPSGYASKAATRRNAYLKIDLAGINYSQITKAEFFWYTSSFSNNGLRDTYIYAIEDDAPDWSGDTLTWYDAPDFGFANENYNGVEPIGKLTQNSGDGAGWGSVDLTDYFATLQPDMEDVTLVMTVNTGATYISPMGAKDGNAPYVLVSYEEGSGQSAIPRNDITVKTVDNNGDTVLPDRVIEGQVTGRTYRYGKSDIQTILNIDGVYYQYDDENSVLETEVKEGAEIIIRYTKIEADEDGFMTLSIPASDSGFTRMDQPGTVQSSGAELILSKMAPGGGGNGANTDRNGFVKFDLSSFSADIISDAVLHVYQTNATNNTTRTLTVYRTTNDWDGATLVWNNQPDATSGVLGEYSSWQGATGWLDFNVFNNLSTLTSEDKAVSFRFEVDIAANYLASHNDTTGLAPTLELTFKSFGEGEDQEKRKVTIRRVDENGSDIVEPVDAGEIEVGRTYFFTETVDEIMGVDGTYYLYDPDSSKLSVRVSSGGDNEIVLVYTALPDGTVSSLTVSTVTSDGKEVQTPYKEDHLWVGQDYFLNTAPEWVIDVDGVKYGYSDSFSSRRISVKPDPDDNAVKILYKPLPTGEPSGQILTGQAPAIDGAWAMESTPNSVQNLTNGAFDVSRSSKPDWADPSSTASTAMQNRIGLLKFDLSGIAYEKIKSAKIHLALNSSSNEGMRKLYAYPVSSAWNNGNVTWNTAPLIPGDRPDSAAGSISLPRLTGPTVQEIDVTEFMENLVGGETDLSFLFEVDTASVQIAVEGSYLDLEYYEGEATEARRGDIVLRTVDRNGKDILAPETIADEIEGRTFVYTGSPQAVIITDDGGIYSYNSSESVTSLVVVGNEENYILLVYDRLPIYPGEPAEVSLTATDNAYVVENAPGAVQDVSRMVQITGTEGGNGAKTNRYGLFKFDTSFINASEVDSAELSFVVTSATNAGDRNLTVYAADSSDWSSATATWNTKPGHDAEKPLDSVTISQNGTGLYTFDVTEYLKEIQTDIPDEISFVVVSNTAVTEISSVAAGIESAMKLKINYTAAGEVGERVYKDVTVRYIDADGELIKEETEEGILGRTFSVSPVERFEHEGMVYLYRPALTTDKLTITVGEDDGDNVITLVYAGYDGSLFYTDNIITKENAWINDGVANMPTTDENGLVASNNGGRDPAGTNCDILLKFDMNYINFSEIVDAKIRFYVRHTDQSAVRTTSAYPISSSWTKGEVTWNNAPSYRPVEVMGTVSFPGGNTEGWYDIDVTDYMAANIKNNSGDFSVRLAVDTACYYVYPVEEGEGTAPRLVVSYLDDGSAREDVTLRIVDQDGNPLEADSVYETQVPVGRTYKYNGTPDMFRSYNGETYVYMEEASTTTIVVSDEPEKNVIVLVYGKENSGVELKAVFSPYMNAYTDSAQPDTVQDTSSYLLVTNMGGSVGALSDRNSYLMFSLAEISFSEITSAKLGFYVNRTGNNTGRTINASITEPTWSADTLTWNNAPAIGSAIGGVSFGHNETGWYEIDITDALAAIPNDTVDLSIGLSSDTASSYVTSIEAGDGLEPKLEITYKNDGTGPSRERVPVYMVVEDTEGNVLEEKTQVSEGSIIGSTYVYTNTPEPYFQDENGANYMFSAERSNLSVRVTDPKLGTGDNTIHIVYEKLAYSGDIVAKTAVVSDNGFTNDAQPDTVQSTASGLLTSGTEGTAGANSTRDSFIKFTLPGEEYKYSKIISAKLRIYVQQATNNVSRTTDFYLIDDNGWSGNTITWNNEPQFGGTSDVYLGSMSFSNGTTGWKELDITDCLAYMDYTDTLSIAFRTDTAANYWGSIASNQAAQLELVYIEGDPVYYERANVVVKTVDTDGNSLRGDVIIPKIATGTTYSYKLTPDAFITVGEDIYTYREELSTLSVDVTADEEDEGLNVISLVYSLVSAGDMYSGYEISPEGSYCWFADNRAFHYVNDDGTIDMTYVGYIDVHGSIKATQYNNLTGEVSETLIRTNFQPDDHDNPAFLVLPDEHILIIYSRHTDEAAFYYRVSQRPGDITTLGPEKKLVTADNTTYPNPFILSDDPEHIYMCWRGVNWHPTIAQMEMPTADNDYTLRFTWGPRQLINSTAQSSGCRPYAKYASNGRDTIYVTYSATHPDNVDPCAIYFTAVQITDFTEGNVKVAFKGATGETLSTSLPFRVTNNETDPSFVVDDRTTSKRGWVWEIALDKDEIPVIAMVRISSDKKSHTYYYAKWDPSAGQWVKTKLDDAGGAFHLSSGTEQCYSGGLSIDTDNPNVIYGSVPVKGVFGEVYEIIRYTMSDDGREILDREQITRNSTVNNVRPYSIPGTPGENEFDLVWMSGDYYYWIVNSSFPEGFPTAIHTNYEFDKSVFDFEDGLDVNYTFVGASEDRLIDRIGKKAATAFGETVENGVLTTTANGYVQLPNDLIDSASFTISAFVEFSAASNWGGTVLSLADGQFKYAVNNSSSVPTLTVSGAGYDSSNIWSNSDWNRTHGGTTDGSASKSNPGEVHLAITYDAVTGIARTYINGMADQYIELAPGSISVNGYNVMGQYGGTMRDFRIYDRVLTPSELKNIINGENAGFEENNSYGIASADYKASAKTVSVEVLNNEEDTFKASVYVASYTPSGDILEVKKSDVEVDARGRLQLAVQLEESVPARGSIKAFLWDGNMRPVMRAVKVK